MRLWPMCGVRIIRGKMGMEEKEDAHHVGLHRKDNRM
jgi:hypothetical protein